MALHIVRTQADQLVTTSVARALSASVDACGRAVLLVPSFSLATEARRTLAASGLALGVTVSTPDAWAADLWVLAGDARLLVSDCQRSVLVSLLLSSDEGAGLAPTLDRGRGTAHLLERLAKEALAWLPDAPEGLSCGQAEVVSLARAYGHRLSQAGLVEGCQVMALVPDVLRDEGIGTGAVVLAGFRSLPLRSRRLVSGLATVTDVTVSIPVDEGPAGEQARQLAAALIADVPGALDATEPPDAAQAPGRAPELSALCDSLFRVGDPDVRPVSASGAVDLLEASGPQAAPELVAERISRLAGDGARSIVVVAPDVASAWRDLMPKLVARGIGVRARVVTAWSSSGAGSAFLVFAQTVAALDALDASWPDPVQAAGGVIPQLGDMGWWPPRDLVDFLVSDISGMDPAAAWALDVAWRGDRILAPGMVLDKLERSSATSPSVAQATLALRRSRVGQAARVLAANVDASSQAHEALMCVVQAAEALRQVGVNAKDCDPATAVSLVRDALDGRTLSSRLEALPSDAASTEGCDCSVLLVSLSQAALLRPCSADALVHLGLTTASMPIPSADDACSGILAALSLECEVDPLVQARASFLSAVGVPTRTLVLERSMNGADSIPTYPAVMLSELLSCYGVDASAKGQDVLAVRRRGEDLICENLSAAGEPPVAGSSEIPAVAGALTGASARYVVVPRNGEAELAGGRPSLSASQIESYLECPYKWFSLRRLRLGAPDAGFGGMEMGTYAHRVLEVTHSTLLSQATDALNARGGVPVDPAADPAVRIPGSRVDASTIARATDILQQEFDLHAVHQYRQGHKPSEQALVPHTTTEEASLVKLRADLVSALGFESDRFLGFEPRFFELRFGGAQGGHVVYGGADFVGSIDRVDVDESGRAVVIDYKHKSPNGFSREYALWPTEVIPEGDFVLPRRVQTLIYASVARRVHPELDFVGAVYFSTKGDHALAGAVDDAAAERIFGVRKPNKRNIVQTGPLHSFDELLDRSEGLIAQAISRMLAGDIEAAPIDHEACSFCPVLNCERRLS